MNRPGFAWSDAWLLTAIVCATRDSKTATLTEVIEQADGINKTVITRGELEAGCNRLVKAGLIWIADGQFSVPDAISVMGGNPRGSVYRTWDRYADHLGVPRLGEAGRSSSERKGEECGEEVYVPKATYEAALDAYRQRMRVFSHKVAQARSPRAK